MEMAISVIITLFVAIAVGSFVLFFASDMIFSTEQKLAMGGDEENKLFWQPSISSYQIAKLMETCHENNYGKTLDRMVCYSVTVDTPVTVDSAAVTPLVDLNASEFIVHNGTTSSLAIVWNYIDSKVEVRT